TGSCSTRAGSREEPLGQPRKHPREPGWPRLVGGAVPPAGRQEPRALRRLTKVFVVLRRLVAPPLDVVELAQHATLHRLTVRRLGHARCLRFLLQAPSHARCCGPSPERTPHVFHPASFHTASMSASAKPSFRISSRIHSDSTASGFPSGCFETML